MTHEAGPEQMIERGCWETAWKMFTLIVHPWKSLEEKGKIQGIQNSRNLNVENFVKSVLYFFSSFKSLKNYVLISHS